RELPSLQVVKEVWEAIRPYRRTREVDLVLLDGVEDVYEELLVLFWHSYRRTVADIKLERRFLRRRGSFLVRASWVRRPPDHTDIGVAMGFDLSPRTCSSRDRSRASMAACTSAAYWRSFVGRGRDGRSSPIVYIQSLRVRPPLNL